MKCHSLSVHPEFLQQFIKKRELRSLDVVQYCVCSCAEIYILHSKKHLKSSSLLASSLALGAWEIKCLCANSQFITDFKEE